MNNARRKAIKAVCKRIDEELKALLDDLGEELKAIMDEEREAYDNMPENLQLTERGETMEENIDAISSVIEELEEFYYDIDNSIDVLNDM